MSDERERIKAEYERRATTGKDDLYAADRPEVAISLRERRVAIGDMLSANDLDLDSSRILDAGCGGASEMKRMVELGAKPRNLTGVDLLEFRVRVGATAIPDAHFALADAAQLPFKEHAFDVALLFTVLSSILDSSHRRSVVAEIDRVLRPGGSLIWYDFRWNPGNRQTVGINPRYMRKLLPGFRHDVRRITLAPPVARVIAPLAPNLASRLSRLSCMCSHNIGLAVKPSEAR